MASMCLYIKKTGELVLKRKIYLIICCLFAVIFIVSAVMLSITLYGYRQADIVYDDLQSRYVTPNVGKTKQTTAVKTESGTSSPRPPITDDDTLSETPGITPDEPDISEPVVEMEPAPISVDFEALLKENSDIVGWLYCEGTVINYPVVQSEDNDYYLRRDLYGKKLTAGTLFVDYRCSTVGADNNYIIYGHNMQNGSMFGTLKNYKKQSYYNEHPVLYFLTPDQDYRIDLFAGLITEATSNLYRPNFKGEGGFETILQDIIAKSTFKSDVSVTADDHVVMFSSCDYTFTDARYVVFGKLTRIS